LGAIYEIGALCAMQEAFDGISLHALDHYVGVSAGSFIAAALANGITPHELCASFIENKGTGDDFDPAWLTVPAYGEFLRRAAMVPALAASAAWRATVGGKPLSHSFERLGQGLPTGIFTNEEVHRRLQRVFSRPGRTNDFRQLRCRLTVVATNLDSGDAAPFGRPGWDEVPISRAVQASSALPGLFPPVRIGGEWFVDGALKKTLHATVALDEGVDLLLCLNPLVPFDTTSAQDEPVPRVVDGGLPAVLSQTFRSMIHSRLELGMKHYERAYPGTDIVLVEPDQRDPHLYLANTFSYRQRRELAEHAYQQTRAMLRERAAALAPRLARHGIVLREDVLASESQLVGRRPRRSRLGEACTSLELAMDRLARSLEAAAARAA